MLALLRIDNEFMWVIVFIDFVLVLCYYLLLWLYVILELSSGLWDFGSVGWVHTVFCFVFTWLLCCLVDAACCLLWVFSWAGFWVRFCVCFLMSGV